MGPPLRTSQLILFLLPEKNNVRPVALSSLTGGQDGDETGPVLTEERRPVVLYPALALLTAVVTPVSPRNLTDPVRAGAL